MSPHEANRLLVDFAVRTFGRIDVLFNNAAMAYFKIGARRGWNGSVLPASSPNELIQAVHDNLRHLNVNVLDVVNLRNVFDVPEAAAEFIDAGLSVLADLQRQGLVRHIGMSNVTPEQIAEGRPVCEIVCVQNKYNLAYRHDDELIGALAADQIAYVPFFPLGGFSRLESAAVSEVAHRFGATSTQVALAWLLRRAPNMLLIPGTSSVAHLRENVAAATLQLPDDAFVTLDNLTQSLA